MTILSALGLRDQKWQKRMHFTIAFNEAKEKKERKSVSGCSHKSCSLSRNFAKKKDFALSSHLSHSLRNKIVNLFSPRHDKAWICGPSKATQFDFGRQLRPPPKAKQTHKLIRPIPVPIVKSIPDNRLCANSRGQCFLSPLKSTSLKKEVPIV